ncbi:ABC transporter substrate-binding protein [Mesorhizobium opportunistum]|uniref:ABC transporter substrate-binding protein n=1 Tax=Mesorhizobium opportunistum TaxID=593909 RepID=A0ABV1YBM4_9HYPH|nr:ABC transporter substrate-binding protein [Mesorhizobium sp.]TIN94332.1 MAG: ABC transporter substrate-binding protein [Mesorhizobium sp.]TJU96088.1 MAG: ABC transporter substrate-binding protein [Mesorhizobium sp.]TJV16320.1 MAG: ABC transporter substrate-binding protein [Mesorhizobium sp.]
MFLRTKAIAAVIGISAFMAAPLVSLASEPFDLSPEQAARPRTETDPALIASIPQTFKFVEDGAFTVAISPDGTPPIATYATGAATVIGADPDIAQLIADKLGRKLNLVAVAWEDWPLGLASGKYDAVISNVGVTEERKLKFDFSSYRQGLHGFYLRNDSPITSIKEPKDIAGLRVITDAGAIQEKIILEWNRINVEAGLKPVEIIYLDDTAASSLAIRSGRADTIFSMNSVQAYQAALTGETRSVGTVNAGWPLTTDVGVVTKKDSGIADAVTAALNETIKEGAYAKVLARWSLSAEQIAQSRTNPPGLKKY